jgi:hypothetical protein
MLFVEDGLGVPFYEIQSWSEYGRKVWKLRVPNTIYQIFIKKLTIAKHRVDRKKVSLKYSVVLRERSYFNQQVNP